MVEEMDELLKELCAIFGVDPNPCTISQIGSGHIHDTYLLERCGKGQPPLILQRINQDIFEDVAVLMHNIEIISAHISYKNRQQGKDPAKSGIVLLETDEGDSWIGNEKVGYWRMFWYIEHQNSYEIAENGDVAFQGGKAIAEFHWMLLDVEVEKIEESIPGFLDFGRMAHHLGEAEKGASAERLKKSEGLREWAAKHSGKMLSLYSFLETNDVPLRIVHNDTKFNNILFNGDKEANCLIDLDMVMPGYVWYDFGDALRTCASTVPEDEENVSELAFRMEIFEAFTSGYLERAMEFLTDDEMETLHLAPALCAYIQGVRYLTDYLKGDVYYMTKNTEHNFVRARAQFALMGEMIEHEEEMRAVVDRFRVIQEQ